MTPLREPFGSGIRQAQPVAPPAAPASVIASLLSVLIAPFVSRGRFSPRLLAAWVTLCFTLRLIDNWQHQQPIIVGGVLVQSKDIMPIVTVLVGLVGLLFGYGAYQKVKLGDTAPAPGEIESESHA